MKKEIKIDGMSCNHCKMRVENALSELDGVKGASVDLSKKAAVISCGEDISDAEIKNAVEELGFKVVGIEIKKGLFGK